ncbi:MAG: alpha-galactosidase [Clostridiales bacterium]|jgi:alpha-galactosidase|nr:alpha-galactosidase [Clostridiales bacterium]
MSGLSGLWPEIQEDRIIFHKPAGKLVWRLPGFPLEGGVVYARNPHQVSSANWRDGAELRLACELGAAQLLIQIRTRPTSPFVRLRYKLEGNMRFTGVDGRQRIHYGTLETDYDELTEISLSCFDKILHSFIPTEYMYSREELTDAGLAGPIAIAGNAGLVTLLAFEHGAQAPEGYLRLYPEASGIGMYSHKGNFYNGQFAEEYLAPWIDLGITDGGQDRIRQAFRAHVGEDLCESPASRYPYLFYNTWNYQERLKTFAKRPYLAEMNEERMLAEIEAAHRIGLEVFVIDTGWFRRAGDWDVDLERFPSGMRAVRERLDALGMRLGLWFNPTLGARESAIVKAHPEYIMRTRGRDWYLDAVWEKEGCYGLCLASGFSEALIEIFTRLYEELGVSYFKWDGIGQYGCEGAGHYHGGEGNAIPERMDAYAYRMGLEMTKVAEAVSVRCPGAIVDFDITEGQRFVGLGFLSGGKYFSINNGPYYENFDLPPELKREPDPINVFFFPGAARAQICRASSLFDRYVPSQLFLTHQLPEGSLSARENAAAALVLGGNGIWGDLAALSDEEADFWREFFACYKKVREAAVAAYPITRGAIGGSPEIHEKLDAERGVGFVTFFTSGPGEFVHVTQRLKRPPSLVLGADAYECLDGGRVRLVVRLEADGARTVFFIGVNV